MNAAELIDYIENIQSVNEKNEYGIKMIYHNMSNYVDLPLTWEEMNCLLKQIKSLDFDDWRIPTVDELSWCIKNFHPGEKEFWSNKLSNNPNYVLYVSKGWTYENLWCSSLSKKRKGSVLFVR